MLESALMTFVLAILCQVAAPPANAAGAMPYWQLPFELGQKWQAGAPHTIGGNNVGARGSVDFGPTGTNKRVVAVAGGTVYKIPCTNGYYLGIDHGNGWRSTYYHLTNQQAGLVGKAVRAGAYLGDAGRAVPCGGYATFDHVHLTILKDGAPTNISGFLFGVYRVYSSGTDYYGYWNNLSGGRVLTINGLALNGLVSTTQAIAIDPTRWYVVQNRSGKVIDVLGGGTANGTAVQQFTANGTDSQKFRFIPTSGGFYQVQYKKVPSRVWEVRNGATANASKVNIWDYVGNGNQQWRAFDSGTGWIEFRPRHVGRCLDVPGASTADGLQLQIYDCNGSSAQDFRLQ